MTLGGSGWGGGAGGEVLERKAPTTWQRAVHCHGDLSRTSALISFTGLKADNSHEDRKPLVGEVQVGRAAIPDMNTMKSADG